MQQKMPGDSAMDLKRAKDKDIKLLKHDVNYLMQTWVIAQSALRGDKKVTKNFQYKLSQLDLERENYQNAISEAIGKAGITTCSECKGQCCYIGRKDESRFYAIDYWLRNYTLYPIPDQDEIYLKHPLIVWPRHVLENVKRYIRFQYDTKTEKLRCRVKNDDRFAPFVKLVRGLKGQKKKSILIWPPIINGHPLFCKYVSESGCKLNPAERPITCIIHFCDRILNDLDEKVLNIILKNIKGLIKLHQEVLKELRKEGRLGFFTGRFRLAIPLYSTSRNGFQHIRRIL